MSSAYLTLKGQVIAEDGGVDSKRHWSKFIPLESLAEYIEYQKKVTREGSAEQCKAGM